MKFTFSTAITKMAVTIFFCLAAMTAKTQSANITLAQVEPAAATMTVSSSENPFIQKLHDMFVEPEIKYWPEVRWWLPSGFNTDRTLIKNVQELYDSGFGAAEFIARGAVADVDAPGSTGAARYHWGSPEWNNDSQLIMKETSSRGMGFSITSGTNWGNANLPNTWAWSKDGGSRYSPDSRAAAKELNFATVNVAAGTQFDDVLPLPILPNQFVNSGATVLILEGVVAAKIITPRTNAGVNFAEGSGVGVLDFNSLINLSGYVDDNQDGTYSLNWTAPTDGNYVLFVYWMHGTSGTANPSFATNYTINYVDSYGVEALIEYWRKEILNDELIALVKRSGRGEIYMDSLELGTYSAGGLFWGYDFKEVFKARRGYDVTLYLPFITKANGRIDGGRNSAGLPYDYQSEQQHQNAIEKIRNDVFQTLTEMYQENVLEPLRQWLHDDLNMQLRAEPSYGMTYEISTPAKYLNTVETESLAFATDIDMYRGIVGGARMYNKVFSSETGAYGNQNYRIGLDYWTQMSFTQFAGGVQRTVFHGYAAHEGPSTIVWPGHEGMNETMALRLNSRNPEHRHYRDWTWMLSRYQKALRQGIPRVDVAILRTDYIYSAYGISNNIMDNNHMRQDRAFYWQNLDLQNAGYTYEYFAPMILEDDAVSYANGLLQPNGPGYQAVIIYQEEIPYSSALMLLKIAQAGLPVIFVDNVEELFLNTVPENSGLTTHITHSKAASRSMFKKHTDAELKHVIDQIKALPHVKTLDNQADALATLQGFGIYPRTMFSEPNNKILTTTRLDEDKDILYSFVYNFKSYFDIVPHTVDIAFDYVGKPYYIDCWTGDIGEVGVYKIDNGRTVVTLTLEPGEASLIVLDLSDNGSGLHAVSSDADKIIVTDQGIAILATASGTYTTTLSNGKKAVTTVTVPSPLELTRWNLIIEDWNAGDKIPIIEVREPGPIWGAGYTTTEYRFETKKTEISFSNTTLMPWKDLTATQEQLNLIDATHMRYVSGLGFYTTEFDLPAIWAADGAYLQIGSINNQSVAVYVNGRKAPPLDLRTLTTDISSLLKPSTNTIEVEVSSPLFNRLIQRNWQEWGARTDYQDYGMTGPVTIVPYVIAATAESASVIATANP